MLLECIEHSAYGNQKQEKNKAINQAKHEKHSKTKMHTSKANKAENRWLWRRESERYGTIRGGLERPG